MVVLPPIVFDSTVLINLAKARLLESLRNLPEALIVPREIHGETVVEGQRLAHPDAQAIVAALEAGILRLGGKAPAVGLERLRRRHRLRVSDASVLVLARQHGGLVGSDDAKVRNVAAVEGLACGGTGYVLARLLRTGILTQREARTHLDRMIAKGWWVTVETYSRLLEELGR